ncbi:carbonic anhydrase [Pyronema omphalodes]|nr:carbonic anhydrase [Pyronema omphalodes]
MKSILALLASITAASACIYGRAENSAAAWSYDGVNGPLMWHTLDAKNAACAEGKHQSPIDIDSATIQYGAEAQLLWPSTGAFNLTNNGHTVEAIPGGKYVSRLGGREEFTLRNFHFHASSEHTVDGLIYPLEAHFVHQSDAGNYAVVGVFFEVERRGSSFFRSMDFELLQEKDDKVEILNLDLEPIIQNVGNVFTYAGSLTTPPCSEGISWFVEKKPLTISAAQYKQIRQAMGYNARFTQGVPGEENLLAMVKRS